MPPADFTPDARLIDQYLLGTLSSDETAVFEAWFQRRPDARAALDAMHTVLQGVRGGVPSYDHHARVAQVVAKSRAAQWTSGASRSTFRSPMSRAEWGPRALSIIGVLTVCVMSSLMWQKTRDASARASVHAYSTRRGEQATIQLADQSSLVLGPETMVRVDVGRDGSRMVDVRGQVFVNVVPSNDRPFVVQSAGVSSQVLGTRFIVRRYAPEQMTRVSVIEGKVLIRSAVGRVVATARTVIQAGDSTAPSITPLTSLDVETAWATGHLVFDGTPLPEAAAELGRRYDIVIRFADSSFTSRKLTASIGAETTAQVLEFLAITLNARYTRENHVVTFMSGGPVLHSTPVSPRTFSLERTYGR